MASQIKFRDAISFSDLDVEPEVSSYPLCSAPDFPPDFTRRRKMAFLFIHLSMVTEKEPLLRKSSTICSECGLNRLTNCLSNRRWERITDLPIGSHQLLAPR